LKPYRFDITLIIIPVNINKITAGNFVFLAYESNKYENIISKGRTKRIVKVPIKL